MTSFKPPPYVLQELPDITESVNYPIKNVQRIKVSHLAINQHFIRMNYYLN